MKNSCLAILIVLTLGGCRTYDYAVDLGTSNVPYRTYYYDDRDREYDFYTVLYSYAGDIGTSINYTEFNVHIAHMTLHRHHDNKGFYVSEIIFDNKNKANVKIDSTSISLQHTDLNGKMIIPVKTDIGRLNNGMRRSTYRLIYEPKTLPDLLIEKIKINMVVDGVSVEIDKTLPIEKTLHYTFWDVLMGV